MAVFFLHADNFCFLIFAKAKERTYYLASETDTVPRAPWRYEPLVVPQRRRCEFGAANGTREAESFALVSRPTFAGGKRASADSAGQAGKGCAARGPLLVPVRGVACFDSSFFVFRKEFSRGPGHGRKCPGESNRRNVSAGNGRATAGGWLLRRAGDSFRQSPGG